MKSRLETLIHRYRDLGIDSQIDYDKFYMYSIITHSTAIEGSTVTELENQLMFEDGIVPQSRELREIFMNTNLKAAYEKSLKLATSHADYSPELLISLAGTVMNQIGTVYNTPLGSFDSSAGEVRIVNVSAGFGGPSYMDFHKVPNKLKEFCHNLNEQRAQANKMSIKQLYDLSFDAHYNLVTIHPWADGNGRMSRLVMNQLQYEFNLVPSKIMKDDKTGYIKALQETRNADDLSIFRQYMTSLMERNLEDEIALYLKASQGEQMEKNVKTKDAIITLIKIDPHITAREMATKLGISEKAVEKHLANLKATGRLARIGANKNGHWKLISGN